MRSSLQRPRLLAVSPACLTAINRAVYRHLVVDHGLDVHLVVPRANRLGAGVIECEPVEHEPLPVTILKLTGSHSRLQRLLGLAAVMQQYQPTHVIVDADPATRLVRDVVCSIPSRSTQVWVITCENVERRYLSEAGQRLSNGRIAGAVGSVVTWRLLQRVRSRIDQVFTISDDGTRAMSRMGFEGRVTKVPLGFDPKVFEPQCPRRVAATRQRLGLFSPTVAYFGRLAPEKGVDLLLRALAGLKDLRWQLLIDRFGQYRSAYVAELEHLVRALGLQDRIVDFDATHEEMPDYMNAADIVVLPSLSRGGVKEQYGRVVPEAMACGKIVIGTRHGAIPELVGDAGFLVAEGDVDALATQIRDLFAAPAHQLETIRSRAKDRAHRQLSVCRQAEIWLGMLANGNN